MGRSKLNLVKGQELEHVTVKDEKFIIHDIEKNWVYIKAVTIDCVFMQSKREFHKKFKLPINKPVQNLECSESISDSVNSGKQLFVSLRNSRFTGFRNKENIIYMTENIHHTTKDEAVKRSISMAKDSYESVEIYKLVKIAQINLSEPEVKYFNE